MRETLAQYIMQAWTDPGIKLPEFNKWTTCLKTSTHFSCDPVAPRDTHASYLETLPYIYIQAICAINILANLNQYQYSMDLYRIIKLG